MARQSLNWSSPYTTLDEDVFYARVSPSALINPRWADINESLLESINLSLDIENPQTLEAFSGGPPLEEWDPIAQVYSDSLIIQFIYSRSSFHSISVWIVICSTAVIISVKIKGRS